MLLVLLGVIVWVACGAATGAIGASRGREERAEENWLGVVSGPFGLLLALAELLFRPLNAPSRTSRYCDGCRAVIPASETVCRYCRAELAPPAPSSPKNDS